MSNPYTLDNQQRHYYATIDGVRVLVLLTKEGIWAARLGGLYMAFNGEDTVTDTNADLGTPEYGQMFLAYHQYIHLHR